MRIRSSVLASYLFQKTFYISKQRNILRTISCLFLYCILPVAAYSQPYVDILNIKSQYFQSTKYADTSQNKLRSNQQEADFFLPLELKNKSKDIVLIGGDFTQLNFDISGNNNQHSHLQTTSLQLGYEKGWKNEKWRTMALIIPKINADLQHINSNDFQAGGVLLF
ncbi:MAG: DUF6268 family outer membrane beta-barrel protein, partial [Bacteroidia bacterium]